MIKSFLCDSNLTTSVAQVPAFWIFLVLILIFVGGFIYINISQYRYRQACKNVQDNLKVGDRVKTFSGIVGEIVKIEELNELRIVTIKNLDNSLKGCISFDVKAVCARLDDEKTE